jgi:hypothetical protein
MIALAYPGSQCTKFRAVEWMWWFLCLFYLEYCIWPDAISQWIWQQVCNKCCGIFDKCMRKALTMIRQTSGEGSSSFTQVFELYMGVWMKKSKLTKTKKDRWRAISRACSYFLWHQGQCSQSIGPRRPKSQFCILVWRLMVTAWKCVKTSAWTVATKELALASQ